MKTYLFDFDGTLVDSMPVYAGLMLRILDEHEAEYPENIIKIITPLGYAGTAKYFVEKLHVKRTEEELIALMHAYAVEAYTYRVPAKEYVVDVVKQLKERGDSLNVLTASPHAALDPCLKRLGIYDLFDNVWSCEDFGTSKADPEIYRMAAKRIGAKVEDVLFLDDNYNADKTAKEAGMRVCAVYDDTSAEYEAEMRAVADHYIHDFSELPEL
ncbi:MAG: HAD family phosphatase [Clostridia bacterium]|nr:HAD family phosphatase [Clostridia bacterium]